MKVVLMAGGGGASSKLIELCDHLERKKGRRKARKISLTLTIQCIILHSFLLPSNCLKIVSSSYN